jgi:hypothetical protein
MSIVFTIVLCRCDLPRARKCTDLLQGSDRVQRRGLHRRVVGFCHYKIHHFVALRVLLEAS